jgi:hypothetical protein
LLLEHELLFGLLDDFGLFELDFGLELGLLLEQELLFGFELGLLLLAGFEELAGLLLAQELLFGFGLLLSQHESPPLFTLLSVNSPSSFLKRGLMEKMNIFFEAIIQKIIISSWIHCAF